MKQDANIRRFLKKIMQGQCMGLAIWANKIYTRKDKDISEEELGKLISMGL